MRVPALRGKHVRAASYFALSALHACLVGRYDIVHVHNSDFGVFSLLLRLRRHNRIVATFHGDPYEREKWSRLAKAFLRLSEWCFVRAGDALTSVTQIKRVPNREVIYIPNGVDPWDDPGADTTVFARVGVEPDRFVMFACGRLDPTKGLHHLLEAYAESPNAPRLLVVGDFGHAVHYSERMRRAAGGDPRVMLHDGLLPRDELLTLVSRSRLFVFPSEVEGMSMMLLEAISAGATVVCSDIPENVEVVGRDYPYLFASGGAGSLRATLAFGLAGDQNEPAMSRLRDDVFRRFRWDVAAGQYADLYERVRVRAETRIPY